MKFSSFTLLLLSLPIAFVRANRECDRSKCNRQQTSYYEDVKCKPAYPRKSDDCPDRYDCSQLDELPADRCYFKGRVYSLGESVNIAHRAINCSCEKYRGKPTRFFCKSTCANPPTPGDEVGKTRKQNCYVRKSHLSPCGQEVCVEKPDEMFKCQVDGGVYLDGQSFSPRSDPDLRCYCAEGYEGENVEPFCKRATCDLMIMFHGGTRPRLATVFTNQTSKCPYLYLSEESVTIVQTTSVKSPELNEIAEAAFCKFGRRAIPVGDELILKETSFFSSTKFYCYKCACELPPMLKCMSIAMNSC